MSATAWDRRTVRGSDDRLRNLRVLHRELGLILEELTTMDEAERLGAHDHQRHAVHLLEKMKNEVGPTGPDPARRQERLRDWLREQSRNGGRP